MTDITQKAIVLKLNRLWQPVGYGIVQKAIVDLVAGVSQAINIEYAVLDGGKPDFENVTSMQAMDWDEWVTLPVRPWDFAIHSKYLSVRVPTVLVAKEFAEMPVRKFEGKPTGAAVFARDRGIDQYTGKKLSADEASVDHVLPSSRGGKNEWENVVLTHKDINFMKGNQLNSEVGLHLIRQPKAPPPLPLSALVTSIRHPDWKPFLARN